MQNIMQQWQPGHELKNRPYRIERVLEEGGFGITYKAWHLALDIPVVIKTPNSKLQKDLNYPKYIENFNREGRQLAKLGLNPHPHIIRVSDLFEEDNLPCIVMDFVPGESLYDLVQTQGALPEAKAVEYIKQIGSALIVCHSAGIIHRDVNPHNILIRNDNGKAVLIDFGISGTTQTTRNTYSGNRAFAPWEQVAYWEGENNKTPQVDIYTLAASFYYLVTGNIPAPSLARKYNNQELEQPKQLNPSLSEAVNQAILQGMEIATENRPTSMAQWLNLLVTVSYKEDNINRNRKTFRNEIPFTFIPKKKTPAPKRKSNNSSSLTVTRRRWLGYVGLSVGAIGVTLIGKNIWDNSPQQTGEVLTRETEVLNISEYKFDVITVNDRGEETKREEGKAKYSTENLGNGITMDIVEIPEGIFMMGTKDEEIEKLVKKYYWDYFSWEQPRHQVIVPSFYMGKFPVTQAQWKAVASLPQVERELNPDPSYFKGDELPVERVSWYDAVEFCNRLSQHTGREFRLPSEAQWEYAARAGTNTPFHFGETITSKLANYDSQYIYSNEPKGEYREKTTPLGTFPPNAFGLYDMHGNVWEWCMDDWHNNYEGAPTDGSTWLSGKSSNKVIRGGSWYNVPGNCRSAYRSNAARNDRFNFVFSFRVVCVSPKTT